MRSIGSTFLFIILCAPPGLCQDDLVVTRPVAPAKYPPAARAVRASGEVSVEVSIDREGRVVSANAIKGHPLLKAVSVEAAKKWEFSASPQKELRTVNLFFIFGFDGVERVRRIPSSGLREEGGATIVSFPSPFAVEIGYETLIPRLLLLPREKGEIIPKSCHLHQHEMRVEIQKECDPDQEKVGYLREIFGTQGYDEAESTLFPWAHEVEYYSHCEERSVETSETFYCEQCRAARRAWLKEHDK